MPKVEKTGNYSNGYDQIFWTAGTEISDVEAKTFTFVKDGTPAEAAAKHEAETNPALAEAKDKTADAEAAVSAAPEAKADAGAPENKAK